MPTCRHRRGWRLLRTPHLRLAILVVALATTWVPPVLAQPDVRALAATSLRDNPVAQVINGSAFLEANPPATATGGPVGPGARSAWARTYDILTVESTIYEARSYGSADMATGRLGARIEAVPVSVFGSPVGRASGKIQDTIVFTNTTGAPIVMPLSWTFSGEALNVPGPGGDRLVNLAIIDIYPPNSTLPMPAVRGTNGERQVLYFYNVEGARTFYNQLNGQTFDFGTSPIWDITSIGQHGARMVTSLTIPPGVSHVGIAAYVDVISRSGYALDFHYDQNPSRGGLLVFGQNPPPGLSMQTDSGVFLGILPSPTAPGAPSALNATTSGNTVSLRWSPPAVGTPATGYTLLARTSPGGPVLLSQPLGNVTSFTTPVPNGTFVLSLVATNALGTGPESSPVTVTTPAPFVAPGPPSGMTANVGGDTATFSWAPPATGGAVTSYSLLAGVTPGFTVPIATVPLPGSQTSVTFSGIPAGTYYVKIVAANPGGASTPSNEVTVAIVGPAAPSAPTLVASAAGSTVTLSWTPGPSGGAPTSYLLTARTAGGALLGTIPLTGSGAAFSGVPAGTYLLTLTAANAVGSSAPSSQVTLVVP